MNDFLHQLPAFVGNHVALSVLFVILLVALLVIQARIMFSKIKELSPAALTGLINRENPLLIDLSGVPFLDSAGLGALIVPQSLARLYHRKDLAYRPISDAPTCPVSLAFAEGPQTALVEEFVGIVRGRKPGSSRGQSQPAPKRSAREKTLAKQAARAAAGKTTRKPSRAQRGRR